MSHSLALKNLLTHCFSLLMSPTTHEYLNTAQWYLPYANESFLHCSMILTWLWCFNSFHHDRLNRVSILFCLGHQQNTVYFSSPYSVTLSSYFQKYFCQHLHNYVIGRNSYGLINSLLITDYLYMLHVTTLYIYIAYCCFHSTFHSFASLLGTLNYYFEFISISCKTFGPSHVIKIHHYSSNKGTKKYGMHLPITYMQNQRGRNITWVIINL